MLKMARLLGVFAFENKRKKLFFIMSSALLQNKSIKNQYITTKPLNCQNNFCNTAVHIVNFSTKVAKTRKNIKLRLSYPISTAYDIGERGEHCKISRDSES